MYFLESPHRTPFKVIWMWEINELNILLCASIKLNSSFRLRIHASAFVAQHKQILGNHFYVVISLNSPPFLIIRSSAVEKRKISYIFSMSAIWASWKTCRMTTKRVAMLTQFIRFSSLRAALWRECVVRHTWRRWNGVNQWIKCWVRTFLWLSTREMYI